ncbi:MAG: permease-like cell division protein FtsX [Desulfobulbaceae bacterium]|jgi:cell division transport system permease protein|nr:permease-like cell division protein FtsX [Desulfobulbaceae bacterium]MDY0351468.1 permease-like cell division protein FtsX [Desulfobulbaceae bacterium]
MNFLLAVLVQTSRNLVQTWTSQLLTLLTVTLSVLIFSFFYLLYTNVLHAGHQLDDDLRLIVYLEEDPAPEMQQQYRERILRFDQVERIEFVSSREAFDRFAAQLEENRDILVDMPEDFLPPSMEVYPVQSLNTLAKIKRFSDYLQTLPGVLKVQYGREWVERFYLFVKLLRVIVVLSGTLLILTTTFMVANTIHLTLLGRKEELEILLLVGASKKYIRLPFFVEGALQGFIGSVAGIAALYTLYTWIKLRFAVSSILAMFEFTFFPMPVILTIIAVSTLLCGSGSFTSTRKFLQL